MWNCWADISWCIVNAIRVVSAAIRFKLELRNPVGLQTTNDNLVTHLRAINAKWVVLQRRAASQSSGPAGSGPVSGHQQTRRQRTSFRSESLALWNRSSDSAEPSRAHGIVDRGSQPYPDIESTIHHPFARTGGPVLRLTRLRQSHPLEKLLNDTCQGRFKMANGTFFVSWELWQQMTFVLAMSIVAVFCAGLVKLCWNNRLMKKQEVLDEEKKGRLEEIRRTGLSVKRTNEVPFGIRAIQGGVEVSGIWISRPVSPSEAATVKATQSPTLIGLDPTKSTEYQDDIKSVSVSTTNPGQAPPKHDHFRGSAIPKTTDVDSVDSSRSTAPRSQFASQPMRSGHRGNGVLDEDTLRRLEGQAPLKQVYDTYIPNPPSRDHRQPSQRSSVSSSAESMDSQPRSTRSVSGRSYTSSHSSKLYGTRPIHGARNGHNMSFQGWQGEVHRDPFVTPARTPSGFSAISQQAQMQELLTPEPTFGPGDMHPNRTTRRVNDGFEVLPAGTFGPSRGFERSGNLNGLATMDMDQNGHVSRNRLRKES